MERPCEARRAVHQALGLGAAIAIVAAAGGWAAARPDGQPELAILAGELRSHSAELQWLGSQADHLPQRFLKAHAQQLAIGIQRTQNEVDELHAGTAWLPAAHQLQPVARAMARDARALQGRTHALPSDAMANARTQSLARAEQALQR